VGLFEKSISIQGIKPYLHMWWVGLGEAEAIDTPKDKGAEIAIAQLQAF
jgi:hypothetical protein